MKSEIFICRRQQALNIYRGPGLGYKHTASLMGLEICQNKEKVTVNETRPTLYACSHSARKTCILLRGCQLQYYATTSALPLSPILQTPSDGLFSIVSLHYFFPLFFLAILSTSELPPRKRLSDRTTDCSEVTAIVSKAPVRETALRSPP